MTENYHRTERPKNPPFHGFGTPTLIGLPGQLNHKVLGLVLQHTTPLIVVSKEDADHYRRAPAIIAEETALEQELEALERARPTRLNLRKQKEIEDRLYEIDEKVQAAHEIIKLQYTFVDHALFYVSKAVRERALEAFLQVNEITCRPKVVWNRHYNWLADEGGPMEVLTFDSGTGNVLLRCPRLHVIIHWQCIPVLQIFLLEHRVHFTALRGWHLYQLDRLKITIVGEIENTLEVRSYLGILMCAKIPNVEIT